MDKLAKIEMLSDYIGKWILRSSDWAERILGINLDMDQGEIAWYPLSGMLKVTAYNVWPQDGLSFDVKEGKFLLKDLDDETLSWICNELGSIASDALEREHRRRIRSLDNIFLDKERLARYNESRTAKEEGNG